jgi:hypothetical protein
MEIWNSESLVREVTINLTSEKIIARLYSVVQNIRHLWSLPKREEKREKRLRSE